MKSYLETILHPISYDDIPRWHMPDVAKFSKKKILYEYQRDAIKNITKTLHLYFADYHTKTTNQLKHDMFQTYVGVGLEPNIFDKNQFNTKTKQQKNPNNDFTFFSEYFQVEREERKNKKILAHNLFNRACFWMATGSGKSLVLIKTIELVDYLQQEQLIPVFDIMLLLPREDLIQQFKKEVADFNKGRHRPIELVHLKKYADHKNFFDFQSTIHVYYGRSDLMRDESKENLLDYRNYLNDGQWYIFLDEAHRGEKNNSKTQNYISVLSKNGFLFNFSATFTDDIDYATTCYNFNLEKFINNGYGKNIYLSESYFTFKKSDDDFTTLEKQKQVLKSLTLFSLIKASRTDKHYYHEPLLITLVHSVNTSDSDLEMFFLELGTIAKGEIDPTLFETSKQELSQELSRHTTYIFGNEELQFKKSLLEQMKMNDILQHVFNATSTGQIEFFEGEAGKEIVLKLQTSDKPFALIKIGDTKKFSKDKLGGNYREITAYQREKHFENLNESEYIHLLLGSRSFYEGWDSNRPNVINLINIGKSDAKKFVLQGIGRGIRIAPINGERKRLDHNDTNKRVLLETLAIFATDKKSVLAILEQLESQKTNTKDETIITLEKNSTIKFDLLVPTFKPKEYGSKFSQFNISKESKEIFNKYFSKFSKPFFMMKYGVSSKNFETLKKKTKSDSFFQINEQNIYKDMQSLTSRIISHVSLKERALYNIRPIEDNDIIHFKHITVNNFTDEEIKSFKEKIDKVKKFEDIENNILEDKIKCGEISLTTALKIGNRKKTETFKDLKITKLANHYYIPTIYSTDEKIDYISHVITVESERTFIETLDSFLSENKIEHEWMFSKIDEIQDNIYIPYFDGIINDFRKFFPDFIFWIKKDNDYKIVFLDPKGTQNANYQSKIDYFETLFFEKGSPKTFNFNDFKITFDLKLVGEDINGIGEKYKSYWLNEHNFKMIF